MGLQSAVDDFVATLRLFEGGTRNASDPVSREANTEGPMPAAVVPAAGEEESSLTSKAAAAFIKVISSLTQGSSSSLSELIQESYSVLQSIFVADLNLNIPTSGCRYFDILSAIKTRAKEDLPMTEAVRIELAEEIKNCANRKPYGVKSKDAAVFENKDPLCVWVWEVTRTTVFSESEQAIIKEHRKMRERFGDAINKSMLLVDQLHKCPSIDDPKVQRCEDAARKALQKIDQAREEREELEKKLAKIRLEKIAKEEAAREKERKKREEREERELQALRRKEEAAQEAAAAAEKKRQHEEAVAAAKRLEEEKAQKLLEKQRNMLKSFVKSAPKPEVSGGAQVAAATSNVTLKKSALSKGQKRALDNEDFERQVDPRQPMSFAEVSRQNRERFEFAVL
jgi:hypothetical protein